MDRKQIGTPTYLYYCGTFQLLNTTSIGNFSTPILQCLEDASLSIYDIDYVSSNGNYTCVDLKSHKAYWWSTCREKRDASSYHFLDNNNKIVIGTNGLLDLKVDGTVNFISLSNTQLAIDSSIKYLDAFANSHKYALIDTEKKIHIYFENKNIIHYPVTTEEPKIICLTENTTGILFKNYTFQIKADNSDKQFEFKDIIHVASSEDRYVVVTTKSLVYEIYENGTKKQIFGFQVTPISAFCGTKHYGVITYQGDAFLWGWGLSGQLGNGVCMNSDHPVKAKFDDSLRIVAADGGAENTVFLAVKEMSFTPMLPEIMQSSPFIQTIRTTMNIEGLMNPDNKDVKF